MFHDKFEQTIIMLSDWLLWILGSMVVIVSFCYDSLSFSMRNGHDGNILFGGESGTVSGPAMKEFIPESFYWLLFITGVIIIAVGIGTFAYRNISQGISEK
jgi:hypothetical protein